MPAQSFSENYIDPFRSQGPNYGMLQGGTGGDRPRTEVVSLPNAAQENEKGLLAGVAAFNEGRKASAEISNQKSEAADRDARLGMEKELQPGRLQMQQAQILNEQASTEAEKASTGLTKVRTQGQLIVNQDNSLKLQSNEMDFDSKKAVLKAAPQGLQAEYNASIMSGNPERANKIMDGYANARKANADADGAELNTAAKKYGMQSSILNSISQLPAAKQSQAFQKARPMIEQLNTPGLPVDQYVDKNNPTPDQIHDFSLLSIGVSHSLVAKTVATQKTTPLTQTQQQITQLQSQIQQAQSQGQDTTQLQQQLKQQQNLVGLMTSPKKEGNNPYDTAMAQAQAKQLTGMDQQNQALNVVRADAQDALPILDKLPPGYTGPIVDYLKANGLNSDVQKLQKLTAGIPIAVKAMYGVTPGNRLTTTELQQLNKASGSTAINKNALQYVLQRLIPQTSGIVHDNWTKQDSIAKNMSPEAYKNWKSANPEPEDTFSKQQRAKVQQMQEHVPEGNILVQDRNGKMGYVPSSTSQRDLEAEGYSRMK